MASQKRVNQGIPTGGQFAAEHKAEPASSLNESEPVLSLELAEALDDDLKSLSQQDAYGNDLAMEQMEAEAAEIREYGVDYDGTYLRHRGPHSGVPINGGFVRLWGRHTPEAPSTDEPLPELPAPAPAPTPPPPAPASQTRAPSDRRPAAAPRKRQGFIKQLLVSQLRNTINRGIMSLFRR